MIKFPNSLNGYEPPSLVLPINAPPPRVGIDDTFGPKPTPPFTSRSVPGEVAPIPIFPLISIVNLSFVPKAAFEP
jgi:hypothetical protein